MRDGKAIYCAFIYSFIFGFSFIFTKMTLGHVGNMYHLLALRFLTAFILMSVLIILKVIRVSFRGKNILGLLLLSFLQPVVYFTFETKGISVLTSSQTGIMMACIPVFTVIFSGIILKEKTPLALKVFIAVSVLGAMILSAGNLTGGNLAGTIFLLAAVCSAGIFSVLSRKLSTSFTSAEMTYFMMALGTAVFNIISISIHMDDGRFDEYLSPFADMDALAGILYLGVLSSVAAFFLMNYTLSKIRASRASVFSNLTTVTAAAAGVVFLHESLAVNQLIGGAMILAGVYGASRYKK